VHLMPRYPIYIPSKGRSDLCQTASALDRDGVPFQLVIEPHEAKQYCNRFGADRVLVLPFENRGTVVPARNFIKRHATRAGHFRHWQLDDNIQRFFRRWKAKRLPCRSGVALRLAEVFADRYENVAVCGLNYDMFCPEYQFGPPFWLNTKVFSCSLILNHVPIKWRGIYNEDSDYCLQAIEAGWCTVQLNAFLCKKIWTMKNRGGNTPMYQGDGRLKMAQELADRWPDRVKVGWRFNRWQHVIDWPREDGPELKLRKGIRLSRYKPVNEYGMKLKAVAPIQSPSLRKFVAGHLS
jgi:hypothetical protein